jgi:integration host factor subunit alpha
LPDSGLTIGGKTVTRADLCEAVHQQVNLSRSEAASLVELVLQEITDCLERGETVKLSSFGRLENFERMPRSCVAANPR